MKKKLTSSGRHAAGYALLIVLGITAASALILAGTIQRTYTVSKLNDRNNQFVLTVNAAEAAAEKVFARVCYDFSTPGQGLGAVSNNCVAGIYQTNVPSAGENSYWTNFVFSDAQGHDNKIYVSYLNNYTGNLPTQFNLNSNSVLSTANAPVYRIVANARLRNGKYTMTNAVQEDVLLALVPISNMAIFSNTNMEFVRCATLIVRGRVHSNGSIYHGCLSSSSLDFNSLATCVGTSAKTALDGLSIGSLTGAVNFNAGKITNVPPINLAINMTNTHSLLDLPASGEDVNSPMGKQRLFNQAQVILLVSNTTVTMKIQNGDFPGSDASPITVTVTNTPGALLTNFNFLTMLWGTNNFYDQRQNKTILASQIDLGKYKTWISTNVNILTKFPAGGGSYPTILYTVDNRTITGSQLTAVRITNGVSLPVNGGLGFSVVTPNSLYVWGHYNQTNAAFLGTSNTTSGTVPSALMSDALTVLSSNWQDSHSNDAMGGSSGAGIRPAVNTTINAALLSGLVYSTGTSSTTYSGGIYNIPRLLEDWGNNSPSIVLTLNTSLISLFASSQATGQWEDPGGYYWAPKRNINYDLNFLDPAKQPPGMPCALIPVRHGYAVPPPNTVTYNVTP